MTKPPLTHQNLAGSTNPAIIWLFSLQSTSPPSLWLRVTRCPDIFLLQQFISCVFPQWLLYCSISSGLPGSPQERRRCRISGGAVHQAAQSCPQRSSAADSSRLQSWESCTWVQACTLKHSLGHLANVIANGCAGTHAFWHDTKETRGVAGGLSNQLRSVNPHSQSVTSEQSTDSSVHPHCKLHCVGAGNFSEDRAGLAGNLVPIGSDSKNKCGR